MFAAATRPNWRLRIVGCHDEQVQVDRGTAITDWVDRLLHTGTENADDTVSANLLFRLLRGAVALGGDRRAILKATGIDELALANPLSRFSAQLALRFLLTIEQQFKDPAILLRVGDKAEVQGFSDLGYVTRLEANLASVIAANVQIQKLRQTMFTSAIDLSAKPPHITWHCHPHFIQAYAPLIELSVASYARLSRQILGEPPLLRAVHFQHQARYAVEEYQKIFLCPVHFAMPETRMKIAARQLFRPSPHAQHRLLEAASVRLRQPSDWMARGRRHLANSYFYLSNALDKSPPTLERMAASFGMTERTLRRKLLDEGLPFRDLLDRVRQDLCALYFLEDIRSLSEIALLLGYSDLSAFTRAYKRWYGIAPSKA